MMLSFLMLLVAGVTVVACVVVIAGIQIEARVLAVVGVLNGFLSLVSILLLTHLVWPRCWGFCCFF
jgi:hypothetical protein